MYLNCDSQNTLNLLNNKITKGNWIVLYHSDMCGYCQDFKPIWEQFVKNNKNKLLNCSKVSSEYAHNVQINPGFLGVPTVHFYKNGKLTKKGVFKEERTILNLNKFVKSNLSKKKMKLSKKEKNKLSKRKKKKISKRKRPN
jgi:thiol-disulfide isomerase/thioredoxin